jgi:hypothetical protein
MHYALTGYRLCEFNDLIFFTVLIFEFYRNNGRSRYLITRPNQNVYFQHSGVCLLRRTVSTPNQVCPQLVNVLIGREALLLESPICKVSRICRSDAVGCMGIVHSEAPAFGLSLSSGGGGTEKPQNC